MLQLLLDLILLLQILVPIEPSSTMNPDYSMVKQVVKCPQSWTPELTNCAIACNVQHCNEQLQHMINTTIVDL